MKKKTILIVDDSASVRWMVTFILKGEGYNVLEAVDGEDGLTKLSSADVHLVITELNMSKLDGLGFIKKIRENLKFALIPILMMTMESQAEKNEAGKAAGATGWIIKPFQIEQLLDDVQKVLC